MSQAPADMSVAKHPPVDRARVPAGEPTEKKYEYPGIPTTCDGAEAVVHVETNISQGTGADPITSSTTMGGGFNAAAQNGRPNLWGEQIIFCEPESEHSSASFCEGYALAGGRVTNGRDHNPFGFSVWLAGGGVEGGMTYGSTDDFGFKAVENPVHIHDLHATILYLMGIDHERLTYQYSGRDFRLTDVAGEVMHDIIA